jgi:hypothetical protein
VQVFALLLHFTTHLFNSPVKSVSVFLYTPTGLFNPAHTPKQRKHTGQPCGEHSTVGHNND